MRNMGINKPHRNRKPSLKAREAADTMDIVLNDTASEVSSTLATREKECTPEWVVEWTRNITIALEKQAACLEEQATQLSKQADQLEKQAAQLEKQASQLQEQTTEIATLRAENAALSNAQKRSIQIPSGGSPTYAAIARTPPVSQPSNISSLSTGVTALSKYTDTPYCTIDTTNTSPEEKAGVNPVVIREAIEQEIRKQQGKEGWKCVAVSRDVKNHNRIRITGRDSQEIKIIKEAAEKVARNGTRVLRDQLYPIKVDNARKEGVVGPNGALLSGIAASLGKENDVAVAKVAWISRRDSGKAYGSMVVYLERNSEANKLLQEGYFHVNGESGFTSIFERRPRPDQCYNCQAMGHKAYNCKKEVVCGRCSTLGHRHESCQASPKCVPCGGPHESFSKNCRVLYPRSNE